MSNLYYPGILPEEYSQAFMEEELTRISDAIAGLEVPTILLVPQSVEPTRPQEGMIAHADGTNWNPGHGRGMYSYENAEWIPMFATNEGTTVTQVVVENTVVETIIYSHELAADAFHAEEFSRLLIGGSYDTGAASDTWTMKVKLGATVLHTLVRLSANNVTGAGWQLDFTLAIRTAGASGILVDAAVLHDDDSIITTTDITPHAIDTTVANTLSVTIQWGAAKVANIFRFDAGQIEHQH